MTHYVWQELGLDRLPEPNSDEALLELEGGSALCGGCLWDIQGDYEQVEALSNAGRSTCQLGFEKVTVRVC